MTGGGGPLTGATLPGSLPLLVGVGSRACGDDAVGLLLVELLHSRHGIRVELWEDRDALTVAAALLEVDGPVVLVDCADMRLEPGSSCAFDAGDARLREHADTVSTHGFGLADALALTRALGREGQVTIFGVQPFDVRPGQAQLTAEMSARLDVLGEALLRALVDRAPLLGVTVELHGLVQGVGMRPTVARLARAEGLGGFVRNRAGSLLLRVEGPAAVVRSFLAALPDRLPSRARLERLVQVDEGVVATVGGFAILDSDAGDLPAVVVPADLVACPACLAEVRDPTDRRHGYPFTTCTDCGPRYSVVERTPYDRARTTLSRFPLCADCAREYADEGDRRYHAESTACPRCGPTLAAFGGSGGQAVDGWGDSPGARAAGAVIGGSGGQAVGGWGDGAPLAGEPLRLARAALARGEVVAARGIGGFQLAVDARNPQAVARLRQFKQRPDKSLAVMAASLEVVRRACRVTELGRAALGSPAAPIVLLDVAPGADGLPIALLSPDTDTLGVMLPTSPLHDLLLRPLDGDPTRPFDWLVVTSGNQRGEPQCLTTAEARERLAFADLVLTHDREIAWRCDDSVVLPTPAGAQVQRRARGYAPEPLTLPCSLDRCVLALGAGLKSTVALGFEDRVVLSPHIGDLGEPSTLDACEVLARALPRLLARRPEAVAVDLHPDLGSTRLGERLAVELGVPVVRVQHHHAHAAACMAEHGVDEALALTWDGVGLGDDGSLWGGELLRVDQSGATRLGTFAPSPLPGGDAAVREPVRQLVGRLHGLVPASDWLGADAVDEERTGRLLALGARAAPEWLSVDPAAAEVWARQCSSGVNAPQSHAVGRLFDSVAALLGLAPGRVSYEGQAAVRLETAARRFEGEPPRVELPIGANAAGLLVVDWRPIFAAILDGGDLGAPGWHHTGQGGVGGVANRAAGAWARCFHETMARAAVGLVRRALDGLAAAPLPVALTGGVFQNRLLATLVRDGLRAEGLRVLEHARVPPNDGGVAFGQAVIAGRVP